MQWLNEPAQWSEQRGSLVVTVGAATDFWRITGYGYVRDNGHLYAEQVAGDFELSMRVRGSYAAQYDQAGAMVRLDERRWLKTGVEYFDGRPRFSTVITLEHSSWAMASLPADMSELVLQLSRCIVATDGTVTDGPYPEAIGGFCIVDVPSREEALEWAAKTAGACRCAVEVREIMPDPELAAMLRQADSRP